MSMKAIAQALVILDNIDVQFELFKEIEDKIQFEHWDTLEESDFFAALNNNFVPEEVAAYQTLYKKKQKVDAWVHEQQEKIHTLLEMPVMDLLVRQHRIDLRQKLVALQKQQGTA
jgi:hypothetical protein